MERVLPGNIPLSVGSSRWAQRLKELEVLIRKQAIRLRTGVGRISAHKADTARSYLSSTPPCQPELPLRLLACGLIDHASVSAYYFRPLRGWCRN